MIPEAAVEAAWATVWDVPHIPTCNITKNEMRAALEAAAPHMLAQLLALADERDKTHGTIRGHITTRELRTMLHDDTQGEK